MYSFIYYVFVYATMIQLSIHPFDYVSNLSTNDCDDSVILKILSVMLVIKLYIVAI